MSYLGTHHVAQIDTKLVQSSCFSLTTTGLTGMRLHTWLLIIFTLFKDSIIYYLFLVLIWYILVAFHSGRQNVFGEVPLCLLCCLSSQMPVSTNLIWPSTIQSPYGTSKGPACHPLKWSLWWGVAIMYGGTADILSSLEPWWHSRGLLRNRAWNQKWVPQTIFCTPSTFVSDTPSLTTSPPFLSRFFSVQTFPDMWLEAALSG